LKHLLQLLLLLPLFLTIGCEDLNSTKIKVKMSSNCYNLYNDNEFQVRISKVNGSWSSPTYYINAGSSETIEVDGGGSYTITITATSVGLFGSNYSETSTVTVNDGDNFELSVSC
tara:strand:- start:77 stop:421 length:345 start_codon:yes stop_codon:yes gene_type:complete